MTWKHCRLLPVLGAAVLMLVSCEILAGDLVPLTPGATTIVTHGQLAFLIHAPVNGRVPIVVAVFSFGGDVQPVPPVPPSKVAGVIILEEQLKRTAAESKVMDDPVWQTAAKARGLTYKIEDKDHPSVAHLPRDKIPVVFLIDSDGALIETRPLPATVEEMRTLIGGLK